MQERHGQQGNTLIEVILAVAITAILIGVVLSIGSEVMAFTSDTKSDFDAQREANFAFRRVSEALRKSGWHTVTDGTEYPLINADEDQVSFQVLTDLDGNGYPFDQDTGELEWDDRIFTIQLVPDDESETLAVFDGEDVVWTLGRHIQSIQFETFRQDNTLHFKEVRVTITAAVTMRDGTERTYTAAGSVHMRN